VYDQGGYFIVKGNEKFIVPQEEICRNKVFVYARKEGTPECQVISRRDPLPTSLVKVFYDKDDVIHVGITQFKSSIPLNILLKAMHLESDKEIAQCIISNDHDEEMLNVLRPTLLYLHNGERIVDKKSARKVLLQELKFKGASQSVDINVALKEEKQSVYLDYIFKFNLLPHIGTNLVDKAKYICYMARQLILNKIKRRDLDDRDSYVSKRIDLPGMLLAQLFKTFFRKQLNECTNFFKKKITNVLEPVSTIGQIKASTLENGIRQALATGQWDPVSKTKKGVSQMFQRLSFLQSVSTLRMIKAPSLSASNKMLTPRYIHASQIGFLCPNHTPEGQNVGLENSLSIVASVSVCSYSIAGTIKQMLTNNPKFIAIQGVHPKFYCDYTKIFLNGEWIGFTPEGYVFAEELRELRSDGRLYKMTSIVYKSDNGEIQLWCDSGRLIRPVLRVKNLEVLADKIKKEYKTWISFISENPGVVDFIDNEEMMVSCVALSRNDIEDAKKRRENGLLYTNYSHCELHPSLILSVIASMIPFSDHNQSPRNTYQCSQAKQGIGIYATNWKLRMDTLGHVLHYPERPLIGTRAMKYNMTDRLPAGTNVIVAIASYGGFNQEDSIIINQGSIERGLFHSTYLKRYEDKIEKNPETGQNDVFGKPSVENVTGLKLAKYDKLNELGYVPEETLIEGNSASEINTVLIGKMRVVGESAKTDKPFYDLSKVSKMSENGYVDKVLNDLPIGDGQKMIKMRMRYLRIPQMGDKFSSRHGQKGTVGAIYPQELMPCTKDGLVPDLIINPHAIPSRMTIGQILESIIGTLSAHEGHFTDGTAFQNLDMDTITNKLESYGFSGDGTEEMYCGLTGEKLTSRIFIGPTYYQKLKQMVSDKYYARGNNGATQKLTRQPVEGRYRGGGLRFGEMERDCMISHGASAFIKERMVDCSDKYTTYVCENCGSFAIKYSSSSAYRCIDCKSNPTVVKEISMPYSLKLLIQHLMSMYIHVRLN
jgi:DNA-directed RNA polymerase II subunit RPB2